MSRIICIHCGFQNFAISAYCGRCERPLPRIDPTPPPTIVKGAPPPAPRRDGTPPPANAPRLEPSTRRSDLAFLTPEDSPVVRIPAPPPPLALEAAPATPIEIGKRAKKRAERAQGPNLGDDLGDPTVEVPVLLPSSLRLFLSRFIDTALVLAVFALIVGAHALITGERFHASSPGLIDFLAGWLSLHPELALFAAITTTAAGVGYSLHSNLRSGRTVGRLVTNTVLVRRSGKPFSWPILIIRGVASLVSAACFGAGFLWAIVDPYHRSFHDIVAGTVVVRRKISASPPSP